MSYLFSCAVCCLLLSVWAVVQLTLMGIFYYFEAIVLIDDVEPHEYVGYDHFIKTTTENYWHVAVNCWMAAVAYAIMIVICCIGMKRAKLAADKEAEKLENDELSCQPDEPKQKN